MNPLSEIEWQLNEHKNQLAEIESYRRRLGYERFDRGSSKGMTSRATRTLIAISAKTRQLFGGVFGGPVARSVSNSRPETSINQ